jgi:uncharacterized membrane protein YgcG
LLCPIVGVVDAGKPCFVQLTCLRDQIGGGSSGSRGRADRPLSFRGSSGSRGGADRPLSFRCNPEEPTNIEKQ